MFAFGDAISGDTTRTSAGAQAQNPIVKHNLLQFLHGRECNAVYDGYTYMPFYMGMKYMSSFSHLHDFEPAPTNHSVPGYGIFGRAYRTYYYNRTTSAAEKYSGFKKHHGPPHNRYSAIYDPLEHNEYLTKK